MEQNPLQNLLPDAGFCAIFRRIGCIGDSLASGEFESKMNGVVGYHDYYEYSWGQFMARACGSTAFNFSCGGLTAKAFLERINEDRFNIFDPAKKAQAYIIALGANDTSAVARGELEMGSMADVHPDAPETNSLTFSGYMGKILSYVKQVEPKARIFLVTMPQSPSDPKSCLRQEHADLMYGLSELFPFTYIIDLWKYAPVYDQEFRKMHHLAGHLNPMGYLFTAKMFMTYIDFIIRSKPEEFAQVGFIGQPDNLHHEEFCW